MEFTLTRELENARQKENKYDRSRYIIGELPP